MFYYFVVDFLIIGKFFLNYIFDVFEIWDYFDFSVKFKQLFNLVDGFCYLF